MQRMEIHHDVVGMPVPNAQDEGGHAVSGAAEREGIDGLAQVVLVVLPDPLVELRGVHLDGR